jgi:PHD/YefM family antitoxin component YafN of YafNO toxin-antitoxin module
MYNINITLYNKGGSKMFSVKNNDNVISSSEIGVNFSKLLEKSKLYPVFIKHNNELQGIMLNIEDYEMLLEKISFLENQLEDYYIENTIVKRKENFDFKNAVSEEDFMKLLVK